MNGNFVGIGADYACNASVQVGGCDRSIGGIEVCSCLELLLKVDASQAPGLLITNGEFTAFHNKDFAPNSTASKGQSYLDV